MDELPGVGRLIHFESVDSTQTVARELAEQDFPDRSLILADRQGGGRGRGDHRWASDKGGIYFTWLLRPRVAPSKVADLMLISGLVRSSCR